VKKVVLELGGSDPFIVLDADDLEGTLRPASDDDTYRPKGEPPHEHESLDHRNAPA
jgi:hypothetical protein